MTTVNKIYGLETDWLFTRNILHSLRDRKIYLGHVIMSCIVREMCLRTMYRYKLDVTAANRVTLSIPCVTDCTYMIVIQYMKVCGIACM